MSLCINHYPLKKESSHQRWEQNTPMGTNLNNNTGRVSSSTLAFPDIGFWQDLQHQTLNPSSEAGLTPSRNLVGSSHNRHTTIVDSLPSQSVLSYERPMTVWVHWKVHDWMCHHHPCPEPHFLMKARCFFHLIRYPVPGSWSFTKKNPHMTPEGSQHISGTSQQTLCSTYLKVVFHRASYSLNLWSVIPYSLLSLNLLPSLPIKPLAQHIFPGYFLSPVFYCPF